MYARLKVARPFLADDGVIAISIDDNEAARVVQMLDELFGDDGRVAQVVVQANKGGRDYLPLAQTHEYLVIYARTPGVGICDLPRDTSKLPLADELGPYEARELRNRNPKFHRGNRPNLFYPYYVNPALVDDNGYAAVSLEPLAGYDVVAEPRNSQGADSCWRWGRDKARAAIVEGNPGESQVVARQVRSGSWNVYEKHRPSTQKAKTIWDETEVRTEAGTREVREMFGATVFDHPKPVDLLKKLLSVTTTRESIVMDYFAGSGSMGHAVMALNAADAGARQFIAIQLPEECAADSVAAGLGYKKITDVAKQRLRLAGKSLSSTHVDVGFRVLRVDTTNMSEVLRTPDETEQQELTGLEDSVKPGRSGEDLLFQVLLDWGLEATLPITAELVEEREVFLVDHGALVACFDDDVTPELVRALAKQEPLRAVFRDSGFASDDARINVEQIFKELSPATDVKAI